MELEDDTALANAVVLTPEQERSIDEALERAKREPRGIYGIRAFFDTNLCVLVVSLSNGRRLTIPQEDLQGVAELSPAQAAEFQLDRHGTGLWWDSIDLGFTVEGLRRGFTGTAKWMAKLKELRQSCSAEKLFTAA